MDKFKMIRRLSQGLAATALLGCGGGTTQKPATTPKPPEASPLSGLVGQPMLITPTQRARVAADLNWVGVPHPPELILALDSAIVNTLHARDAFRSWVFGDGLVVSFNHNPTFAPDPRALSIEPLVGRGGTIPPATRLTEPLASQVRNMIALHDARLVMIPVELRFESVGSGSPGMGRAILRLVLVDPRASDIQWMTEVKGDAATAYGPGIIANLATKVANLFIAP